MADTVSAGSHSALQILIVNDDPSIRLLRTTSLGKAGYCVLEDKGSSEPMTLYTTATPPVDVVLADLFLSPPDFQLHTATIGIRVSTDMTWSGSSSP